MAINTYVHEFKEMDKKQQLVLVLSYFLITFIILIYTERIVINDIVMRIQTLIIDE